MTIGMSKLDAVNACLQAISEYRVDVLDPGGTSIQADAERIVDESTRYHCSMGWPCNTRKSALITVASAGNVTVGSYGLPAGTLRVKSAGSSQHRTIVLRGDKLYDSNTGTFTFQTGDLFLDIAELLTFEDCEPILKEQIAAATDPLVIESLNDKMFYISMARLLLMGLFIFISVLVYLAYKKRVKEGRATL